MEKGSIDHRIDQKMCSKNHWLQGMRDQDIRARTLIQTAAGKLSKLSQVVEYIAAEETGIMQSKDICHETVDVSGVMKSEI